uniref:Transposase n=1 Tax=Steinernema glaseri TaxID=37863 RepID=A0A1I7Y1R6_9BILA
MNHQAGTQNHQNLSGAPRGLKKKDPRETLKTKYPFRSQLEKTAGQKNTLERYGNATTQWTHDLIVPE